MVWKSTKKGWRVLRGLIRGLRLGFLLIVLLLATMVLYCNEVGLPNFLKRPLLEGLHTRGIDLEFSRVRWRWYRGLVAEDVHFTSSTGENNIPQFSAREVELKLAYSATVRSHVQVDRFILHGGDVYWRLSETNQPLASLSLTNIETQLRLFPNDRWQLDHFTGDFAGTRLHLAGTVTNATQLREWKLFNRKPGAEPGLLNQRLRQAAQVIEKIRFSEKPEVNLVINGDAAQIQSFNGFLSLHATSAFTPWGTLSEGRVILRLLGPTSTNDPARGDLRVEAERFNTRWGSADKFNLRLRGIGVESLTNLIQAHIEVTTDGLVSPWASASSSDFKADWTHSPTNFIPLSGEAHLSVKETETKWASARELYFNARLSETKTSPPPVTDMWDWWEGLQPYWLDWDVHINVVATPEVKFDSLAASGFWHAPEFAISNFHADLFGGHVEADAQVNVTNRLVKFSATSAFDLLKIVPLLPPQARNPFENQQLTWEKAPVAQVKGSVILPAWTNRQPDWKAEVLPTLTLAGDIKIGAAAYRQISISSAGSSFSLSNLVLNLPDLVVNRPEGRIDVAALYDDKPKDFYFKVHSSADPKAIRPLFAANPKFQKGFDMIQFAAPPVIDGEIWGRVHDFDRLGAKAFVTATNVTFRGAAADYVETGFSYTNQFILLTQPKVFYTNQTMTADSLGIDIPGRRGFLTNGVGNYEPMMLIRTIGKKIAADMEPYHFTQPPLVHGYGVIPLSEDISVADLHFTVEGGTFEWLKFHAPYAKAKIDWVNQSLSIRDITASFYNGKLTGMADFDFRREVGTDFRFDILVTDTSLQFLMADLTRTNRLEGTLNGHLAITQANSHDLHSWFGSGQADLSDALIFEIPIFGILSPVLNAVSPNLGSSRASKASATFTIANSVIRSDDLEIRSPTIRLYYHGNVDFNLNVDATIEAQVGHDAPLVGPLVSTVLTPFGKLFETRVTGTLTNPKQQPVYFVTKVISPFMHPFRTIKDIFTPSATKDAAAKPAEIIPPPAPDSALPASPDSAPK